MKDHYTVTVDIKKVTYPMIDSRDANNRPIKVQGNRDIEDITHIVQKSGSFIHAIETAKAILEIAADQEASRNDEE